MKRLNGWTSVFLTGGGFGCAFALIGWFSGGRHSSHTVLFHLATGFFLGAIAAPELQPKAFRYPAVWQVSLGALGGTIFAASLETSRQSLVAGAMIGGMLGFLAPYWIKHVDVP